MPARLIRDGLMESEAMLSVPVEARWLFIVIMLSADDLGMFEATEFALARRADVKREIGGKLLMMLADADLIRLYESGGKRYGFIPKFRQRLQIKRPKFPLPPAALYADDPDVINKINDLRLDPTAVQRQSTAGQPPEAEAEAEAEEKKRPPTPSATEVVDTAGKKTPAYRPPSCPSQELVDLFHQALPSLPNVEVLNEARKRALSARWREVCADGKLDKRGGLEWFSWYFGHVARSPFLLGKRPGRSGRTWIANFDFLLNPTKFARIVEGAYHETSRNNP